jgi:O-antigen ligase
VTLMFAQWQREAARDGVRDRRFAGPTDHVHNDFLETLVERGLLGLAALFAPIAITVGLAVRAVRPVARPMAGACAAMAAVVACALVDFPLARPVELTWWWIAFAVACESADRHSPM